MAKPLVHLDQFGDVLTVPEAARLLRIGRNAAYEAAKRGQLPVIPIGRRLVVPKPAIRRLLEEPHDPHQEFSKAAVTSSRARR